ncbi:testis-expressed protein 36 [Amblyraja radiata]|uniref:testis-expressed protein 36 n=1 Tax=Amblyraja radiata TaxID=386614 RepID=UPI001403736B|nr:testis-expressed protein 36 [Amblyraja radiata]
MPKGRHCNPCTRNDGQWFPHLDVQEPTFTAVLKSTKGKCIAMQENRFSPIQLNDRLPLLFKVREKYLLQGNFPFSAHDNKYSLRHTGDHLDLGLGRKKVSAEKQTVDLRDPGKASMMKSRFGITIYQTSYLGNQDTEHPNYRRYPKIPRESSQMAQSQNSADLMWFGKNNSRYRIPMEVLGITQRSLLSTDKKFYRTRFLPK